jgi:hypothetical protein
MADLMRTAELLAQVAQLAAQTQHDDMTSHAQTTNQRAAEDIDYDTDGM